MWEKNDTDERRFKTVFRTRSSCIVADEKKPRFIWNGSIPHLIWKYERKLQNYEYHLNNKHKIRTLLYKYAYTTLGIKLGVDIPTNAFGSGLDIVHVGYVVVSPKNKMEKIV